MPRPIEHPLLEPAFARGLAQQLGDLTEGASACVEWSSPQVRCALVAVRAAGAPPTLWEGERGLLAHAVPKRQAEFAWGRWCCRRAMARIGAAPAAVTVGAGREPIWPGQLAGSITHTDGLVAAAVVAGPLAIGIDGERLDREIGDDVWALVLGPDEMSQAAAAPGPAAARLAMFSLKEALFKLLYPEVGRLFEFKAARVTLAAPECGARVELLETLSPALPAGLIMAANYVIAGPFVFSWSCRPRPAGSAPEIRDVQLDRPGLAADLQKASDG